MTSMKHHVTIESVEDEGEKRFQDVPSSRSQCINLAEMMNGYDFEGEAPSDRMTSWREVDALEERARQERTSTGTEEREHATQMARMVDAYHQKRRL
ncbi:predicted protein [Lichtheimia corymbifera JMRC:FSU:9682]|uniref:Uncharacterized protein n=1 Tax=Lichtheimia corymbifera JMRC:FSU:9682 TaxID=1263082 RepID=A0A068RFF4_9FUNG|nr:predicted protein [Lichtheimia corymbifera JMRC:FSU:9682]